MKKSSNKNKVFKVPAIKEFNHPKVPHIPQLTSILQDYKSTIEKCISSNNESMKSVENANNETISSLQQELKRDDLTFEERKYYYSKMEYRVEAQAKKDTENKVWLNGVIKTVTFGISFTLISTLGGGAFMDVPNGIIYN